MGRKTQKKSSLTREGRLALIKKIHTARDEGRFIPLTDDDIEDELALFRTTILAEAPDEFEQVFIDNAFERGLN